MSRIKVLVVDDSAFMRKIISDIINSNEKLEVIDTARDGKEAIDKIKSLKPDVVTLDVEMPNMDGLTALEIIMKESPSSVLMLSSVTKEGADATLKALELGAFDFITKPSSIFKISADDIKKQLVEKILLASKVRPSKLTTKVTRTYADKFGKRKVTKTPKGSMVDKIIAIGTSTGGPKALQSVIPLLPGNINAPILIVQHMPAGFTKSLAERLDNLSDVSVKEAEDGDQLKPGWVYIAPGDYHIKVNERNKSYYIELDGGATVSGHRPSADVMFESVSNISSKKVIAVIMTGMGSDGAKSLKLLKEKKGGYVIAQDENSCVVYGMPGSAVKLGAVDKIVSLNEISNEIMKVMGV